MTGRSLAPKNELVEAFKRHDRGHPTPPTGVSPPGSAALGHLAGGTQAAGGTRRLWRPWRAEPPRRTGSDGLRHVNVRSGGGSRRARKDSAAPPTARHATTGYTRTPVGHGRRDH